MASECLGPGGLPVGLYIHIPFCLSKCAYCDFFSEAVGGASADAGGAIGGSGRIPGSYVRALCNEIAFRFAAPGLCSRSVDSVYVGGGTPSLLSPSQISSLFSFIRNTVPLSADCEITMEVNPDDVSEPLLEAAAAAGVNRLSCGIQSMCEGALAFCRRRAVPEVNRRALSLISGLWKGDFSVDLISALPFETEASLLEGLGEVAAYDPAHISLYSLTIEGETPLGALVDSGSISYDFDAADRLWLLGRDFLEAHGYLQYEVSNFCRSGKECRHNVKYWSRGDYAGCGCTAAGTLYSKDGAALRWNVTSDIKKYTDFWLATPEPVVPPSCNGPSLQVGNAFSVLASRSLPQTVEAVSAEECRLEFFMMGLRKTAGIKESEYIRAFGTPLPPEVISLFERWQEKKLAQIIRTENDAVYTLGKNGIIYLNSFLKEL